MEATKEKTLYTCPMHPQIIQDHPGECPICGMTLVKIEEEGEEEGEHEGHVAMGGGEEQGARVPGRTRIKINTRKQQLINVRTAPVKRRRLKKIIRTVGRVDYDERRVAQIHTKIQGWIEKLHVDYTGKWVQKGEPLLSIYSPELLSTQEEYLLTMKSQGRGGRGALSLLAESTRHRLELWDIPEAEIQRVLDTGKPLKALTLYSPISGHVIKKHALEGMHVTPGMNLFTIADLSKVWVLADIYEYELPLIKVGQEARVTLPYYPGEEYSGKASFIYPYMEGKTRTVKVRFDFPNPKGRLKPEMYVNVHIASDAGVQLAIPREAIIDTGEQQFIFVAEGGGYFSPRRVKLGLRVRDHVAVLEGVEEGEEVVTSGNFLIDSESQLRAAIEGMTSGHQH